MNNTLQRSDRRHHAWFRSTTAALTGLALGLMVLTATAPASFAQGSKTNVSAADQRVLDDLCVAVKKNRNRAPQLAQQAAAAHPNMVRQILRTVFQCLGTDDCRLLGRVLRALVAVVPGDASALYDIAVELAPNCATSFPPRPGGGGDVGDGFGLSLPNQNPAPGTIAGGGGQGNVVAICHNGHTLFVSPQGAQNHLNNHPGDRLGACVVTAVTNQ
ncbi:MAG: hypothetical protein M3032_06290 [Verrucomicrobiota bacterium]|nr:hypothetical protein [Verrucomicrobiota bacterium]